MLYGAVLGVVAWIAVAGILVWVPRFLEVIEPTMPVRPVIVLLVVFCVLAWLQSIVVSWQRR